MSSYTIDDLAALPRPEIIETQAYEAILAARKTDAIARAPAYGINFDVANLETDPVVILLEESAFREVLLRARGNDIARARYLYYARGAELDHLGAFYDVVRMFGEDDARFVRRTILAIQGRSTGGTEPRYKFVAMSASTRVADVHIYTEGFDPTINVAVFAADNNGIADQALLDAVEAAVTDPSVRMVNDTIVVRSAVVTVVPITAALTLLPNTGEDLLATLASGLPAAWVAESGLGRDLTLDWLRSKLVVPSVYKVASMPAPAADVVVSPYQAVRIGAVTLTVAGRAY
jgi:phage-related baseplate assembly protein